MDEKSLNEITECKASNKTLAMDDENNEDIKDAVPAGFTFIVKDSQPDHSKSKIDIKFDTECKLDNFNIVKI